MATNADTTTVVFQPMCWTEGGLQPIGHLEPTRWEVPTALADALGALNAIPDPLSRITAQAEVLRTPTAAAPEFVLGFSYDHAFGIEIIN